MKKTNCSNIIAVEEIGINTSNSYGVIGYDNKKTTDNLYIIKSIIEKPMPDKAHSNIGVVGCYILDLTIFGALESITKGTGNELQLTDAIW